MRQSLFTLAERNNETYPEKQREELKEELRYQMKRLNVQALDSELDYILKGLDEGIWSRLSQGPFMKYLDEIWANINVEAEGLCQNYLEADNPEKLAHCSIKNRELLLANIIFNEETDNQSFNEYLRKLIFDEDTKFRKPE